MKTISSALNFFLKFHQGTVNRALHIVGFSGIIYAVAKLDWKIFLVSLVVVELGHIYNNFKNVEKYDFRFKTIFWRIFFFGIFCLLIYLASKYF